jgi:hypothetical protein
MTVGGDPDLLVEGQNATTSDCESAVCAPVSSLGGHTSQQLHRNSHETINGIDARTNR